MASPPRSTRARAGTTLLCLMAGTIALAGCASSNNSFASKTPSEILAASRSAAEHASSVHITREDSDGRLALETNLELIEDGGHARTSVLGIANETIRIADTLYVKGSSGFDSQLQRRTGLHIPENTWIEAPVSDATLATFAISTNLDSQLRLLLAPRGSLTKGATTTVDGHKAIELEEATKLGTRTIYIAATGRPYPLEINAHGRESSQTTFTAWNRPIAITPPANAVELSKLEKR